MREVGSVSLPDVCHCLGRKNESAIYLQRKLYAQSTQRENTNMKDRNCLNLSLLWFTEKQPET